MNIALAQIHVHAGDLERNRRRAVEAIEHAAARGCDLVALPELFTVGYFAFDEYAAAAEPLEGETVSRLCEVASKHGVAVLGGSIVEDLSATRRQPTPADEGLANTSVLIDANGEVVLVYRKHHLFGYGSAEQQLLDAGEHLEVADIGGFTVGVSTCYDLRFPELYRELVDMGATLVLVPSAWPYPRVEHWDTLSRARAIENQCYLATINGSGSFESAGPSGDSDAKPIEDGKNDAFDTAEATLLGRSTVYDPWGVPIASSGDEPTTIFAALDPTRVETVRDEFPALADRRR